MWANFIKNLIPCHQFHPSLSSFESLTKSTKAHDREHIGLHKMNQYLAIYNGTKNQCLAPDWPLWTGGYLMIVQLLTTQKWKTIWFCAHGSGPCTCRYIKISWIMQLNQRLLAGPTYSQITYESHRIWSLCFFFFCQLIIWIFESILYNSHSCHIRISKPCMLLQISHFICSYQSLLKLTTLSTLNHNYY